MNNSAVVPMKSSFMIDDILRSTHDPRGETLTQDHSSSASEKSEISSSEINSSKAVSTKPNRSYTTLSDVQKNVLLQAFSIQQHPSKEQLIQLADYLDLKYEKVRCWFANLRGREKKKHLKKLRQLDALASSLSSSRQPIIQARPLRSCSCYGYPTKAPVLCRNLTLCGNRGLIPRNFVGPVPVYRRSPQSSRASTGSKQLFSVYEATHDLRQSPLIQLNACALPPSLPRPAHHQKVPIVSRFRV